MSGRPARRSLADAFSASAAPRDRAAGLSGLLPPRSTAVASAPARPALMSSDARGELEGSAETEEAASLPAGERAAGPSLGQVRNVAVYLPVDLLDRLKRTRRSRELTYSDLLVEAAAAHLDGLEAVFRTAAPQVVSGMPSRVRRRLVEPGVQVQLRLDGHQLGWLDEQVTRLSAPSRTALVVALFQAHLT